MSYTYFDPAQHSLSSLAGALMGAGSQLSVVENSIRLHYGDAYGGSSGDEYEMFYPYIPGFDPATFDPSTFDWDSFFASFDFSLLNPGATATNTSLSFYDGTLTLGIGSGLLLTSGDGAPPRTNADSGYSQSFQTTYLLNAAGRTEIPAGSVTQDQDLRAAVDQAFTGAGELNDITSLEFTFNVTDPAVRGIRFDVVFGSDEYPEYTDSSFVDIAGVFINGTNYALFNQSPTQPLSILNQNLAAGNFIDNQNGTLPIEYDGLSSRLQIVAPVNQGLNTFKIAVGDTGDSILDSGIFVSSLVGVDYTGFGLAQVITVPAGTGPFTDAAGNQIYDCGAGNLSILINGGNDVVNGGSGFNQVILGYAVGNLANYSFDNGALSLWGPSGTTQMVDVERVRFSDLLVALDTQVGGNTWNAFSLLHAGFGTAPDTDLLSRWTAQMDQSSSLTDLAQRMLDYYAPQGVSNADLITLLYQNLAGITPSAGEIAEFENLMGPGRFFAGQADLLAYASQLDLHAGTVMDLIGVVQVLDPQYWAA